MAFSKLTTLLQCEDCSSDGPQTAFSAGCVVDNVFYLHGGVAEARSTKPCNKVYRYFLENKTWKLADNSGPALSHHTCLYLGENHIIFIGGWNGKERSSDVHLYNYVENMWLACETSGFPVGGGLSSHTANLLSSGEILVIGREGSLRMQRRSGNAFMLTGSVATKKFAYRDLPISVASRSGHTTSILKGTAVIIGGRSDKLYEMHKVTRSVSTVPFIRIADSLPAMTKLPGGRKHHSATVIGSCILVYGGETFDGRSKEPVAEVYIVDLKENYAWKSLGKGSVGRAGHIAVHYGNSVLVHGGVGERNVVSNLTFQIKILT